MNKFKWISTENELPPEGIPLLINIRDQSGDIYLNKIYIATYHKCLVENYWILQGNTTGMMVIGFSKDKPSHWSYIPGGFNTLSYDGFSKCIIDQDQENESN